MNSMDPYEVLGVSREATLDEIKKAYKKSVMACHPDKVQVQNIGQKEEQEDRFKQVQQAYSILSNEDQRRKYDMGELLQDFHTIDDVFDMMFGTGISGMGSGIPGLVSSVVFCDGYGEDDDGDWDDGMEPPGGRDFIQQLNRLLFPHEQEDTEYPKHQAECQIGLRDILCGGTKHEIAFPYTRQCSSCKGFKCMACQGLSSYRCKSCYGGCKICSGLGIVQENKTISVTFPMGVSHGDIIRVPIKDSMKDMVDVTILHKLSDNVQIEGFHVLIFVDISVIELMLGFETTIQLPDSSGTILTIRKETYFDPVSTRDIFHGMGIKKKGDVIIQYRVSYPSADDPVMVKFQKMLRRKVNIPPKQT